MAGAFPDVPAPRMPYDIDGTGLDIFPAPVSGVSQSSINPPANTAAKLNSETEVASYTPRNAAGQYQILLSFPDIRIISGYWFGCRYTTSAVPAGSPLALAETSIDGANFLPVTTVSDWTNVASPFCRSHITSVGGVAALAVRFTYNYDPSFSGYPWLHLYGSSQIGQTLHRLAIWNPTQDLAITPAYLDWGDVPRGSSADRTFRLKNISPLLTAVTPTVSVDTLDTSAAISPAAMHLLSQDGMAFAATQQLPTIPPGGFSGVLTLRRSIPAAAPVGLTVARLRAIASNWT